MNFCEAAGFEYVPAFNMDETPQDMADFIEYAKGPADSEWGRKRVADGHPQPYQLRYMELGNEERVDETYAAKFEALAKAIWAKDPDIILVVGDFAYGEPIHDPMNFTGAASRITSLAGHRKILSLARSTAARSGSMCTSGPKARGRPARLKRCRSYIDALAKWPAGRSTRSWSSSTTPATTRSGARWQRRWPPMPSSGTADCRSSLPPTACNPTSQNDNGWNQGLLFLNPSQVWLQPPGYVTQMLARNYLPQRCEV